MLTLVEKIIFILFVIGSIGFGTRGFYRIYRIVMRNPGKINWIKVWSKGIKAIIKTLSTAPVFRLRLPVSLLHGFVAWGFFYYLLVNLGDVMEAFIPGFHFLGTGQISNLYRLGGDILSSGVLLGMASLMIRRFVFQPVTLSTRQETLLHKKARAGMRRDSAIVGLFILTHVGTRFVGESLEIAESGADRWQPLGSLLAHAWSALPSNVLITGQHITFWLALGTILLFIPYFPYSKHLHLIIAPLNFMLTPERKSIGELEPLNFDDDSIEQFGATRLEDLSYYQLLDAYACIMCFRCQEVCPAYNTGKVLSPAALEINKRYHLNYEGRKLANGDKSETTLLDFAITREAIWACTACGACTDICPVGNDPMRDISDIRRALVLMENDFPEQWQTAFRGMERTVNPWNIPPSERLKWADGLDVPTVEQNPDAEILWWVGCAPATDIEAQKTARAFAKILSAASVNYCVLGKAEQCTGDAARRAGNEFLFHELAKANVEILNEVNPKRIITTCPHCLHTLKNEYPAYGGNYEVIHHSQLIAELEETNRLHIKHGLTTKITFHDPCYLGRQNHITEEPRQLLQKTGAQLVEMPHNRSKSFCCGAGGAQMWKEEEDGTAPINATRTWEAVATSAELLAVGCPFCMLMLNDARKDTRAEIDIQDIAQIIAGQLVQE